MLNLFNKIKNYLLFRKLKYQPLVKVLVFKNRILDNLKFYQNKYPGLKFAPVLKSNAYGHGLFEAASVLENQNIPFLVVDSFFEALSLRKQGIKTEILVIGFCTMEQINIRLENVSYIVTSIGFLKNLSDVQREINIHLKIDTGMFRQGILQEEIREAILIIKSNPKIKLEGVLSHLADADNEDASFTQKQIETWNDIVNAFENNFAKVDYFHLSATAGIKYSGKIKGNVARLGIGLYGIAPSLFPSPPGRRCPAIGGTDEGELKPALQLQTIISSIKEIKAGGKVGYNNTFTAPNNMKIATLPVGYYEGVDRRLSNVGFVKVKDKFCRILGKVSMNITTIDVSEVDVEIGDEAIVISPDKNDKNSVENIAKICNTIPYEILVHLPKELRREVVW